MLLFTNWLLLYWEESSNDMHIGLKWIIGMFLRMSIWLENNQIKLSTTGLFEYEAQKLFSLTWKRKWT